MPCQLAHVGDGTCAPPLLSARKQQPLAAAYGGGRGGLVGVSEAVNDAEAVNVAEAVKDAEAVNDADAVSEAESVSVAVNDAEPVSVSEAVSDAEAVSVSEAVKDPVSEGLSGDALVEGV